MIAPLAMSESHEDPAELNVPEDFRELYQKLPMKWRGSLWGKHLMRRYAERRLPPAVYLELTSACNLNCVMCPTQRDSVKRHRDDGFMDPALFRRLVDEIAAEDPHTRVGLHKDGEPMLHPQVVELVDYATSKLDNVTLVTNGTLMSEEKARGLLETRLRSLRFSVDGLTRETFEKVRRQSPENPWADPGVPVGYADVHASILRFCALKRARGNALPRVGVRVTDFAATRHEIAEYRSYWEQRVDFVEVARLLTWAGQVGSEREQEQVPRYPCMALWNQLVVNWNGSVLPCCVYVDAVGDGKGIVSNVRERGLREAAYAPGLERLRKAHLDDRLDDVAPFCATCSDWRSPTPLGDVVWTPALRAEMEGVCRERQSMTPETLRDAETGP